MPARLARRYDEPVDVERRDDVPVRFVRRGRGYHVGAVLAHWWETGPWWEMGWEKGRETSAPGIVGDDERELWRVEAVALGRGGASPAVVELCLSWSDGTWALTGVLD